MDFKEAREIGYLKNGGRLEASIKRNPVLCISTVLTWSWNAAGRVHRFIIVVGARGVDFDHIYTR